MIISLGDIATILTALVAIIGLTLSIYKFYVDRRDKTPRLVAKISNGGLAHGEELSELMLFLEITNPGEKAVKISAVEILWKKHKFVFFKGIKGSVEIPFDLKPGDNAIFWVPMKEVQSALKQQGCSRRTSVKACFRTAVDSEFISKPFQLHFS